MIKTHCYLVRLVWWLSVKRTSVCGSLSHRKSSALQELRPKLAPLFIISARRQRLRQQAV